LTRREFLSGNSAALLAAQVRVPDRASAAHWWKGPLCISDVQLTPDEVRQMGPDAAAAKIADLGFNVQELAFPALPGYEGSYLRAPWRPEDYLAFIKGCHSRDIRVTPYLNVHGFYTELAQEHPDWPERYADGKMILRGNGVWVPPCYNGPWRSFALDAIAKMVVDYDVDGMFLDGPSWSDGGCYCKNCRAQFHAETGEELPAWNHSKNPAWPRFVEFRIASLGRFLKDLRARLDQVSPQIYRIIYMNNSSLGGSFSGARSTRRMAPYLDILGNERANVFNAPPQMTPLWMVGAAVKILETQAGAHGQQVVEYCCFRHLPWDYLGLPAAEYRIHVAGALANGAHPQVMGGLRYLDDDLQKVVKDLNSLQRRHPEVYCNSTSLADVALLWPQATADLGGTHTPMLATQVGRGQSSPSDRPLASGLSVVQDEFYGWAEVLFRGGYAYDVIDDVAIEEGADKLTRYRTLILPAAQCLSSAACAAIEAFVRRGGHLVATATTSLCSEHDVARPDFALAQVFGASYAGRLIGPLPIDYLEVAAKPPDNVAALMAGIRHGVIPAPPTAVGVRPNSAYTLASHLEKLTTRYEPIVREEHPQAAILANRYGSGTCVFLPGTFGTAYWLNHFPDYRNLLQNAIRWRCPPQVSLKAAGNGGIPDTIEVSWRRAAGGEWVLHLVNHTGTMARPIEQVLPVHDLRIRLRALAVSNGRLRASALVSRAWLKVEHAGDVPVLLLPRLDAYEAVVLSPA
jgi:hypothetical protein